MATMWMRRRGETLVPNSKAAALEVAKLPADVPLRVEAVRTRSGSHHRLVWALFSLVADALNSGPAPTPKEWTAEDVALWVKVATGHVTPAVIRGQKVLVPASIAYDAMDQAAFSRFSQAAFHYIATELCPWIKGSPHWPEVAEILARSSIIIEEKAA